MRGPRTPFRAVTATFAVPLLAAATLAGCSDDDGFEPLPLTPPPLTPVWIQPDTEVASPGDPAAVQRVGDRLFYTASDRVTALDATTGDPVWQYPVRQGCGVSKPNRVGDVVVMSGPVCREAIALDGATGEERWRTRVAGTATPSVGDRAVTLVQDCGRVTRLSLRDGHRLRVIAPRDRDCAYIGQRGEKFQPLGIADGVRVGWQRSRLVARDIATGDRLWTRKVPTVGPPSDDRVILESPIVAGVDSKGIVLTQHVLDLDTAVGSQTHVWLTRWDLRTGEDAGVLGRIDAEGLGPSWAVVDGLLVSTAGPAMAFELPDADPDLSVPGVQSHQ